MMCSFKFIYAPDGCATPAPICVIIFQWQKEREKLPEPNTKVPKNNRLKQG